MIWGSRDREHYRAFKVKQLGQTAFDVLFSISQKTKKRDRYLSALYAIELLKTLPPEQVPEFIKAKYLS